jgi:hypothetical protein
MVMVAPQVVYWHRELPPAQADPIAEHTVEADSVRVPGTIAHRDELWADCRRDLFEKVDAIPSATKRGCTAALPTCCIGERVDIMASTQPHIDRWREVIQAEYHEMPALHLTKPQIRRLWSLDASTCDAVLEALEREKVLRRTSQQTYVLEL